MTPSEAAGLIADLVWTWSKEAGSPMVLTVEDRQLVAEIIATVTPAEPECITCERSRRAEELFHDEDAQ